MLGKFFVRFMFMQVIFKIMLDHEIKFDINIFITQIFIK